MAKVRFHPLFEHLRGTIKGMVFRLSHNGKVSAYMSPDMSRVKWSSEQDAHRERMAEAWAYAKQAVDDPQIKEIYLQMARKEKHNKRPYDMAASDYFHNHNNLLGERFVWDVELWRAAKQYRKRNKQKKR